MPSDKDTVLFTSNCFGEDRSAALIAVELQKLLGSKYKTSVRGASLISKGEEYSRRKIPLLFSSYIPPSGGFPTRSLKGFLSDLFTGSLGSTFRFIKTIKKNKDSIRLAVVVGDVSLLFLTRRALKNKPIVFLAPAKSDYIEPHYQIEEWYIKKNADVILTHDHYTADNLKKKGLSALFLGNPMVDGLEPANRSLRSKDKKTVTIGILPGSREEAYDNFIRILDLAASVNKKANARFIAALPGSLGEKKILEKVKSSGWSAEKNNKSVSIVKDGTVVRLTWGMFPEVLDSSDFLIGLAGTAVEQAAALGKPVVSFTGSGPQTTKERMVEQERLLGGAMKFARKYPEDALNDILLLCANPAERKKRGAAGIKRMGRPGGAKNIAKYIFDRYIADR